MVLASLSSDKIKLDPTCSSSHPQETCTSTLPCRSVHAARAPRHIWRSTLRVSLIVRLLNYLALWFTYPLQGTLEELIKHGLHALRETLQQDKELNINNTSIGIIGPAGVHEKPPSQQGKFRIIEGESVRPYLESMDVKAPADGTVPVPPAAPVEDVQMSG